METRLGWLAQQLGVQRLLDAPLATSESQLLAGPYDATPAAARCVLDRLCQLMHVEPARIELRVNPDDKRARFVCGFVPGRFDVSESHLREPQWLIPSAARGLGHQILLALDPASAEHDRDWVADLLPVFHGLGVVVANAASGERGVFGANYALRRLVKAGNLSARTLGYALALLAWSRQETDLAWASTLRPDAADVFRGGLRYLEATGDTVFDPLRNRLGLGPDSPRQLRAHLRPGRPRPAPPPSGNWAAADRPTTRRPTRCAAACAIPCRRFAPRRPGGWPPRVRPPAGHCPSCSRPWTTRGSICRRRPRMPWAG